MVQEAANPLDVVKGRMADRAQLRKNDKVAKVAEKGAQGFEIARCKTEIGACRRRKRRASSLARDRPQGLSGRPPTAALSGARKKLIGRPKRREIFPGRKSLKSQEMRKESRSAPATAPESPAVRASPPRRS